MIAHNRQIGLAGCRQHGAVLVTSLLMLLVMTILGAALLRNTTLDERMAMNAALQNKSLQAAESAGRSTFTQMLGDTNKLSAAMQTTGTYTVDLGDSDISTNTAVAYLGSSQSLSNDSMGLGTDSVLNYNFEIIGNATYSDAGGNTLSSAGVAAGFWVRGPATMTHKH
jgi:type IV pilus assembly protein PilX